MERKYELTEETMEYNGVTLHRIRALRDFNDVKAGELGGWIETEENLSQKGNCWVYDDARVFGNARVDERAEVYENAWVFGDAHVFGNARVDERAEVYGNCWVYGDARVFGNARVDERAEVYENARVSGNAKVYGNAEVYGNAVIYGSAKVYRTARIKSVAKISSNSIIRSNSDFIVIGPIGSREDYTTFSKSASGINVVCGCFSGTIEEFEEKVKETHKGDTHELDYLNAVLFVKNKLMLNKEDK